MLRIRKTTNQGPPALRARRVEEPGALSYTGGTEWDGATGTLKFTSSGTMPPGQEEFFWLVPQEVRKIIIAAKVTVRGGFRVPNRAPDNPLRIEGTDRETSILFGTEEERWTMNHGIAEDAKWKYGAVSVLADATVHVSELISLNPRGYHISGYARRSILHLSRCKLVDSRGNKVPTRRWWTIGYPVRVGFGGWRQTQPCIGGALSVAGVMGRR